MSKSLRVSIEQINTEAMSINEEFFVVDCQSTRKEKILQAVEKALEFYLENTEINEAEVSALDITVHLHDDTIYLKSNK